MLGINEDFVSVVEGALLKRGILGFFGGGWIGMERGIARAWAAAACAAASFGKILASCCRRA